MIRRIIFLQTVFVFLLASCQGPSTGSTSGMVSFSDSDGIYKISLEKALNETHAVPLSTIGSEIEYIPLETNSNSLLSRASKIAIHEPYIFVMDRSRVLQFKNDGSFVRQIGSRGQGPGEYQHYLIKDIVVDSVEQRLVVLNLHTHIFDFNGNHIKQFRNNSLDNEERVFPLKDNQYIYYFMNQSLHPKEFSLIVLNENAEIIKTFINHHKRRTKNSFLIPEAAPFYLFQHMLRFKEFGSDTLSTLENGNLVPYAIFDLGNKALPTDVEFVEVENIHGKYWLLSILEDHTNFYIRLTNWPLYETSDYLQGVCSKTTGEAVILKNNKYQNDIDGGLPFFPRFIHSDNICVDGVQAFELRKHVLNGNVAENRRLYGKKYDDLVKLANSLDDESNPVLIMVKK